MPQGDMRSVRETNLRLGALLAEVEGVYSALLRTNSHQRHQWLCEDLARAARRLADLAAPPPDQRLSRPAVRRSRWQRRRVLAEHGAAWIVTRYGREKS
jgi:hypothetical protein